MAHSFAQTAQNTPFAQIVPLRTSLDAFTYRVPDDLQKALQTGCRVLVPFGERWVTGIVVGFCETCDLPRDRIKAIAQILDPYPLVTPAMLDLCRWMAWYYLCSLSEVLLAALPSGIHLDSGQHFALEDGVDCAIRGMLSPRQREVVAALRDLGSASMRQLQNRLGKYGLQPAVHGLLKRGVVVAFQKMSVPKVKTKTQRMVGLVPRDSRWFDLELPTLEKRAPRQAQCIRRLRSADHPLSAAQLSAEGISSGVLRGLAHRNLIRFIDREVVRDPYAHVDLPSPEDVTPTPHQSRAIDAIEQSIDQSAFRVHLLRGVTGSGKTLVYIRAVAHALASGKGAIVLVPEITLTPQTVRRFRIHFGDRVAVLHSALSAGERYDAWREVRTGKRAVVIGARSAIFAPVENLGLIVIDEEHDGSYKQDDPAPRYNARDVAVMRARLQNLPVVLGSATPSLESHHNAQTHKFNALTLPERIDSRTLPHITLVDMRDEGGGLFSRALRKKMRQRIEKGQRIILLQNRRGYAPAVQCAACGRSIQCHHCHVTLTYHATQRVLLCHYCGYTEASPASCPSCNSGNLLLLGAGTQRVEETLEAQFPGVRVLRMDVDTTSRKGAHDRILDCFSRGGADILLGTQMIAKGLDFPGVTLVGVISADTSIHLPDFRASERTFQLLTQVSGRAGRGDIPGEVVIQTYMPDGEAVQCAQRHDFETFAQRELHARQSLGYPPFGRVVLLLFKGKDEHAVARAAGLCTQALRAQVPPDIEIMGPVQAPIARIQRTYRWQVLLKSESHSHLNAAVRQVVGFNARGSGGVSMAVNVDPVSML